MAKTLYTLREAVHENAAREAAVASPTYRPCFVLIDKDGNVSRGSSVTITGASGVDPVVKQVPNGVRPDPSLPREVWGSEFVVVLPDAAAVSLS